MKKLIILLIATSLYITPGFSQIGTIKGSVVDSAGNPLANTTIDFTSEETTTYKQTIQSSENGSFILTGLKPGHHFTATFNHEGFNTQVFAFKQGIGVNEVPVVITMYTLEEAYEQQGGNLESLAADQAAREYFNTAVGFFKEEKFVEALDPMEKAYENYAKIEEGDPLLEELAAVPRLYAIIAYNTEKYEDSKKYCEVYLKSKPDDQNIKDLLVAVEKRLAGPSPEELYNQAVEQINQNNDAGAMVILKKAIASDPQYSLSYFQLGKIYTRDFEFEEAIKNFKTFIKLDPNNKMVPEAKELIVTLSE